MEKTRRRRGFERRNQELYSRHIMSECTLDIVGKTSSRQLLLQLWSSGREGRAGEKSL